MSRNSAIKLVAVLILVLISGCATLPKDFDRPESHAYTETDDTRFGRAHHAEKTANFGQSGFFLLGNGLDAFVARAVLAHGADRSIDVQYYLYHNDLVARLFTDQLLKAADRGVRVRLLVDDMDLKDRDLGVAAMDSHPNVEVRIFNPFSRKSGRITQFVTRMGSVTRRMHNKSFTVDNQVTILGGRNMGNEYFEADPDLAFSDLDVMVIGPAVQEVSTAFDLYWNSELAYPAAVLTGISPTPEELEQGRQKLNEYVAKQADSDYLQALKDSDLANAIRQKNVRFQWGEAVVFYDHPEKILHDFDKTEYHLAPKLAPFFNGVQEEFIIFSPYFVPGKKGTAFLSQLSQRGVKVRILTNSLSSNDVGIVHAGYSKYRKDLLRAGVELYEMNKKMSRKERKQKKGEQGSSKASLHTKSFVFDRNKVFIGSLNLDPRAVLHNTEIGVVLENTEIATGMSDWFDQHIEEVAFRLELNMESGTEKILWHGRVDGKQQTFNVDPYTGFWQRFGIGFLSLFPIDSQL
jgi:putative cardiolipin synthase